MVFGHSLNRHCHLPPPLFFPDMDLLKRSNILQNVPIQNLSSGFSLSQLACSCIPVFPMDQKFNIKAYKVGNKREKAQQAKVLTSKPDDLSSISRANTVEGEKELM